MIDTKELSRGVVLSALYNASKPQGMGFLHYNSKPMTEQEASDLLDHSDDGRQIYFDYLHGRVMKVDLTDPNGFEERLYDRDNGAGAAKRAIDAAR